MIETKPKPKAKPAEGVGAARARDIGTQIHYAGGLHAKGPPPKMTREPLSRVLDVAVSRARDLAAQLSQAAVALETSSLSDKESAALIARIDDLWFSLVPMSKERGAVLILMNHIDTTRGVFEVAYIEEEGSADRFMAAAEAVQLTWSREYPDFAARIDLERLRLAVDAWGQEGPARDTGKPSTMRFGALDSGARCRRRRSRGSGGKLEEATSTRTTSRNPDSQSPGLETRS